MSVLWLSLGTSWSFCGVSQSLPGVYQLSCGLFWLSCDFFWLSCGVSWSFHGISWPFPGVSWPSHSASFPYMVPHLSKFISLKYEGVFKIQNYQLLLHLIQTQLIYSMCPLLFPNYPFHTGRKVWPELLLQYLFPLLRKKSNKEYVQIRDYLKSPVWSSNYVKRYIHVSHIFSIDVAGSLHYCFKISPKQLETFFQLSTDQFIPWDMMTKSFAFKSWPLI